MLSQQDQHRLESVRTNRNLLKEPIQDTKVDIKVVKEFLNKLNKNGELRSLVLHIKFKGRDMVVKISEATTPQKNMGFVEIQSLKLVKRLVEQKITPHIAMPIAFLVSCARAKMFAPGYALKDKPYTLLFTELAAFDFNTLLKKQVPNYALKCILFEILYTLAV